MAWIAAAQGSTFRTLDFVALQMGMTESAVQGKLGPPTEKSGTTWTYQGDGAATLEFSDGALSSVIVEPADPVDPSVLLPGKLKGRLVDGPVSGDVLRGIRSFEAAGHGVRVELYRGKTSRISITRPWSPAQGSMTLAAAVSASLKETKSHSGSIKKRVSR